MNQLYSCDSDIIEFSTLESECVYLPNRRMQMEYKYIKNCSLNLNTQLIRRGWRRFGHYFSRPKCTGCTECLSLRIDASKFDFSKSVRRVIKKNINTKILIRTPSITHEHIKLYEKYHKFMQIKRGWDYYPVNKSSYEDLYASGFNDFGKEVLYFIDQKLVGVDLIDFIKDGISSIYFFYDPDYLSYQLGKFSIYKQIEFARQRELKWIYLGYYVKDSISLSYKKDYKPHQILQNNPTLQEKDYWI